MLKRILGLHSKKERGKSEKREGEKMTSVILGETGVTTPSEIIPYYHLNHSMWSLSDNKESFR
jgi:hypothetical protein